MTNSQIAELLEETSVLLEIEGANPFRVRAYQRAAQVIGGLSKPVSEMAPEELLSLPGIGKGIQDHLKEILGTGQFQELVQLRAKIPKGLLELLRVPGLGPKRARVLFDQLGIDSLSKLREAAQAGRLAQLAGFGDKLVRNILEGLEFAQKASARMLHWEASSLMGEILRELRKVPAVQELSPAGSLRRGRETVGDLDILCTARDGGRVIEAFTKLPQVERVMASGQTRATVWLRAGIQCDLRVVPPESFGAALQYFTGSKDHNIALREHALKHGLTVNEYGVFRVEDREQKQPLAGRIEEEVYSKLGLAWIPAELRENRGEIEAAQKHRLPRLVELQDIRGDFHNHSDHTDGANRLEEMARAAKDMGWEWVALGDHSQSLGVAKGLTEAQLRGSLRELEEIRSKVKGIRLMRSMEVDILKDGSLDYPDEVLQEIDVVIGSVHSAFSMDEATMTRRILKALRNPHCDIIGHLSGRLLNRREAYKVDTQAVLKAAAEAGTALEINGQPQRQDLSDVHARQARELGVALAVTTDAHSTRQFEYMKAAVTVARRAWLTKDDLLNCKSFKELKEWLGRRKA